MEKNLIETTKTKITVDGSIINELSEKIPSNIVAINELIKNAYDANANIVNIFIDLANKKITIIDDGDGMSEHNIAELFHISYSQKEYGKIINERITQGSKGLGFLAVFRFGKTVTWSTNTGEKGFQFTVNLDDIIEKRDISNFPIVLTHDSTIKKGTKIEITLDDSNIKLLQPDLIDQAKIKKIVNSFCDNKMKIKLTINNEASLLSEKINTAKERVNSQIMKISFDSTTDKNILFEYPYKEKTFELAKIQFDTPTTDFDVKIELFAYFLVKGETEKFNALFHNPEEITPQLTPLLYINNNLFNNYNLFNVNINRRKSSGQSLPQLIGTIKVYSKSKDLIFNSDRTQFVQNELTNNITDFLQKINIVIQNEGSKRKKHLNDFQFFINNTLEYSDEDDHANIKKKLLDNIKNDFYFKNIIKIDLDPQKNSATYEIFDHKARLDLKKVTSKKLPKSSQKKPLLELTTHQENLPTYGDIIDLREYIKTANDSNGQKINPEEIKIEYDKQNNNFIATVESPRSFVITFSYLDTPSELKISKKLTLVFQDVTSKVIGNTDIKEALIKFNGLSNYEITFNPIISRLVNQINDLYSKDLYLEVIACSLRSIFELSIESIREKDSGSCDHQLFDELKETLRVNKLKENVVLIIKYFNNNDSILSKICTDLKISRSTTKNLLNSDQFEAAIVSTHLGAHKSTTNITKNHIDDLGIKTGIFLILLNELLK